MGRRVERTRAGGTWTESRYFGFIRSLLRRGFTSYPVKYQVKKAASRPIEGKRSLEYQCNVCKGWFSNKEVEVDHIKPAGSLKTYEDLPGFVERMFCEADNLQVICKGCHHKKTQAERKARKKK